MLVYSSARDFLSELEPEIYDHELFEPEDDLTDESSEYENTYPKETQADLKGKTEKSFKSKVTRENHRVIKIEHVASPTFHTPATTSYTSTTSTTSTTFTTSTTSTTSSTSTSRTSNQTTPKDPMLRIQLKRRNCPSCGQPVTAPANSSFSTKELELSCLFKQLQVSCSNCTFIFCFACLSQHNHPSQQSPCEQTKQYIAHRICKHLNCLLLDRDDDKTVVSSSSPKSTDVKANQIWGKGVGYGGGSCVSSTPPHLLMEAKRKKLDKHVTQLLSTLLGCISRTENVTKKNTHTDEDEASDEDLDLQNTGLPNVSCGMKEILDQTCLVDIIFYYLRNDSFLDIQKRVQLYDRVLRVISTLCNTVDLVSVLDNHREVISSSLGKLEQKAKQLLKCSEQGEFHELLGLFLKTFSEFDEKMKEKVDEETTEVLNSTQECGKEENKNKAYCEHMRQYQFGEVTGMSTYHYYSKQLKGPLTSSLAQRICMEMENLADPSFISDSGSSILVRVDSDHFNLLRAMITGPPDTPYSYGCWTFDILIPYNYPSSPPSVWCTTTGFGTVRFNPNLYENGKVCLSLLGTWHGAEDEKWNPAISTISQVLLSLQSMVFVAHPYFNEPGYQSSMNTEQGKMASNQYNQNIINYTLRHAIVDHVIRPPLGFEEPAKYHFQRYQEEIQQLMKIRGVDHSVFKACLSRHKNEFLFQTSWDQP